MLYIELPLAKILHTAGDLEQASEVLKSNSGIIDDALRPMLMSKFSRDSLIALLPFEGEQVLQSKLNALKLRLRAMPFSNKALNLRYEWALGYDHYLGEQLKSGNLAGEMVRRARILRSKIRRTVSPLGNDEHEPRENGVTV